jgi:hypothetical protein
VKRVLLLAVVLACTGVASLADTVDQEDIVQNAYMAAFAQTDLAQSFTPSANNSSGAGVFLYTIEGSQGITISLWDNLPNQNGNELASATSGAVGANQWVDVFWNPVAVTPGKTYYLVFTSVNNASGLWGDVDNNYPGGNVFANPGYQSYPDFDYTFREYSSGVPEPATLSMLGAGVAFAVRRLRRR